MSDPDPGIQELVRITAPAVRLDFDTTCGACALLVVRRRDGWGLYGELGPHGSPLPRMGLLLTDAAMCSLVKQAGTMLGMWETGAEPSPTETGE